MHVYLQYANSKKNTNIVVHYITLANYGKTGWASEAMPILPSANRAKFQTTKWSSFFLFMTLTVDFGDNRENRKDVLETTVLYGKKLTHK